ncbi:hypothetical protein BCV69DRAFT_127684 [Microstroma glucosiphilum]|uniref:Uncharacterized protein n=1 Tax=Pseudomicrostroma glucosiphilum TaxID=1684307 RepID=A0A316TW33_9BASI|nr:hypothetical protein BCV69DRAFT_127684 [Pseudomicrostroma glucosiphilum]PWN17732.1 hypothetical protein BCV69DRAFT_127684 [Pseudomicrostroma glucosiphilum]
MDMSSTSTPFADQAGPNGHECATLPQPNATQPYTFAFEATPAPYFRGNIDVRTMVPEVLLGRPPETPKEAVHWLELGSESESGDSEQPWGEEEQEKEEGAEEIAEDDHSSRDPHWDDDREALEAQIKRDAAGRFYPEFYVMRTSPAVHASANTILDTCEGKEVLGRLNEAVDAGTCHEAQIAAHVCTLSELIRRCMGAGASEYGKFVSVSRTWWPESKRRLCEPRSQRVGHLRARNRASQLIRRWGLVQMVSYRLICQDQDERRI